MHEHINSDTSPENEDISKELSRNYILSIQLSKDWFSYCILDTISNKFITLSSYSFDKKKSKKKKGADDSLYVEKLDEMVLQFNWLKNPFKKVFIIFVNRRSTIVPSLLFNHSNKEEYLHFSHGHRENEKLYYDFLRKQNVYNVYAVPDFLEPKLKSIFKSCKIYHYSSTLIMNVFSKLVDNIENTQVFINVQFETFDLIIAKKGELIFYNSFRYLSDEDLIFYMLYVIKHLTLDAKTIVLKIMGEIEKGSELYKNICKYVNDVSFVERNSDFRYIDVFDDIPPHFYYNLLNANLCV